MDALKIRDLIAAEMKKQGLSQTELARLTGLEQSNISRYLKWTADNITPTALRLLDALDLELIVQPRSKADGEA